LRGRSLRCCVGYDLFEGNMATQRASAIDDICENGHALFSSILQMGTMENQTSSAFMAVSAL
jgi:hypothetical protein